MASVHPQQKMMEYGFTDFNGNVWWNAAVDSYNRFTRIINESGSGVPGSLAEQERDFFLDQRHRHFVQILDICAKEKGSNHVQ